MRIIYLVLFVFISAGAFAQIPDMPDTVTAKIEDKKVEAEQKKAEANEKVEKVKEEQILSEKAISYDRNQLKAALADIEKPVFTPGAVTVESQAVQTSNGVKDGFRILIPEVDLEKIKKDWFKTLKKASDSDVVESGNSYVARAATVKKISDEPLDIEIDFIPEKDGIVLHAVMEKDSAIVTQESHPKIHASMKSYLQRYGVDTYKEKVKGDIKLEDKALKDLKKEQDNLIKKNEKEHKKISDNQILVDAAEDNLKLNDIDRKKVLQKIEDKRANVSKASGKDAVKIAKQEVKSAEKEKGSLDKQRKKLYRDIVEYKSNIEKSNQFIDLNLQMQKDQAVKIYKQELKINALNDKFSQIK